MDEKRSLKYSLAKEVTGDSVIGNYTYKKIIAQVCANSIQRADSCELQRIDSSGNVYYFFDGTDRLRYDFSKGIGERFVSPYPDRYWEVGDKYTVVGFGDTLQAIDFYLYNKDSWYERVETVTENFGMTYYKGRVYSYEETLVGNFFGGILNSTTSGNLLVKKQKVDWREFYPLHIGDFWKYKGHEGVFETITVKSVIGDTLMPDNNIYKVIAFQKSGGPYPGKGTIFERFDSIADGNVMSWNYLDSIAVRKIKFSVCLGDTFSSAFHGFSYLFDDKSYNEIQYSLYPDLTNSTYNYSRGMGLTSQTGEFYYSGLVGAVINGTVYGDTTITLIDDKHNTVTTFELYQNYPNPFNPTTTVSFTLSRSITTSIKIYNILGKEITTLVEENLSAGEHTVQWNGKDQEGNLLSGGVYFIQMIAGSYQKIIKTILLK
ncbi:MAG: T9SS type A sorting domain-containing protein [Ignavibacteriaceae bacterium]|nr:T9SS type A sorting domain-containing protein [Ignavibacteriaceae bacterium]